MMTRNMGLFMVGMLVVVLAGCGDKATPGTARSTEISVKSETSDALLQGGDDSKRDRFSREATLITPGERFGPVTANSTEAELAQALGQDVMTAGVFYLAEGFCEPATVLFPKEEDKTMQIRWGDTTQQADPVTIQILGEKSVWHTAEGITLGTTAKTLEKMNGTAFKFSGFGWDYGGNITSWNKGALAETLPDIALRLNDQGVDGDSWQMGLVGDRELPSSKLADANVAEDVVVDRLVFTFAENAKQYPDDGSQQKTCDQFSVSSIQ